MRSRVSYPAEYEQLGTGKVYEARNVDAPIDEDDQIVITRRESLEVPEGQLAVTRDDDYPLH